MARSNKNAYWSTTAGWRTASNTQFERNGDPGVYTSVKHYTGTQLDFTGSDYGYGAILVQSAGVATASLSSGGTVAFGALPLNEIIDLSVSKITGTGEAYIFKRQQ
jgi:hypothetical protein